MNTFNKKRHTENMNTKKHLKLCIYVIKLGTIICRLKEAVRAQYLYGGIIYLSTENYIYQAYICALESKENRILGERNCFSLGYCIGIFALDLSLEF